MDRDKEYYAQAIENGWIRVNNQLVSPDYIVKDGEQISHQIHRHEPQVPGERVRIVHASEDVLIVDKPAGIPVHPVGRYNENTLVNILKREHGIEKLYRT